MFWDEFPETFRDGEVEAAASKAALLEGRDESISSVADTFKKQGEDDRSSNDGAGLALIADGLACDLRLTHLGDDRERWGPFGPMIEIGGGAYPPPLPTFPDALRPYFERRAMESASAELRARYNDLLWVRWKDFPAARRAHASYLEASEEADLDDPTSSMSAVELLLRAAALALTLRIEEDATIQRLQAEIIRDLPHETTGFAAWIARESADLLARRPETARAVVDAISTEAANAPSGRRHRERSYLDAAEAIARASGDAHGPMISDVRRLEVLRPRRESGLKKVAL